ncbi:electron transporter SenC [Bradyrhizobium sacchari]|uniref:Protein SCO1/2 n=1 Tax=Bradyrhizobium sacchari TaxID=1399419 RepID=A0A560JYP1_9BRAD|nr:electron transporter SenC [Bradyrhizobium sacchari]TWB62858.1 protein SCO1/2 [Bradyrhizobium sacchari]TWB76212.1 protein SCO1/2 [Bradyrhizobium sacchari]
MRGARAWLCVMLALACAGAAQARSAAETMDILMWNREPVGGPFELIDQTGTPRSDRDFLGRLMLIYFGFTYCPDVCPTDLMAIGQALEQLGPDADAVQPVFITLDPERDTVAHLAEYVPLFHPRLLGLTGSPAAIEAAAEAYKVYFAKVSIGKEAGDYTVDHTSFIYLMDRDGKYLGFFPPGTSAERMVEIIRPRLAPPSR